MRLARSLSFKASGVWIAADRVFRAGANLLLLIWIARAVGPETYGVLAFAVSVVALFSAFGNLGADGLLTRSFAADGHGRVAPRDAIFLRMGSGVVALALAVLTTYLMRPGDDRLLAMTAILASQWVIRSADVFELWFQAKSLAAYPAFARVTAFVVAASLQVVAVATHAPLWVLALAMLAEYAIAATLFVVLWMMRGRPHAAAGGESTGNVLKAAKWTFAFALAVAAQARIDQLMIGHYVGDRALGQYAAALRLVEGLMFIPGVLVAAVAPAIYQAKARTRDEFEAGAVRLYKFMLAFALAVSAVLVAFPREICTLAFGPAYLGAAILLPLLSIRLVLGCVGMVRSVVFTAEGRFRYLATTAIIAALMNVVGNWLLVPAFGAEGAIAASSFSFLFGGLVVDLVVHDARFNNWLVWRGMTSMVPRRASARAAQP